MSPNDTRISSHSLSIELSANSPYLDSNGYVLDFSIFKDILFQVRKEFEGKTIIHKSQNIIKSIQQLNTCTKITLQNNFFFELPNEDILLIDSDKCSNDNFGHIVSNRIHELLITKIQMSGIVSITIAIRIKVGTKLYNYLV